MRYNVISWGRGGGTKSGVFVRLSILPHVLFRFDFTALIVTIVTIVTILPLWRLWAYFSSTGTKYCIFLIA